MTDVAHGPEIARERGRRAELWEFRALVAAAYPLFLVGALARRAAGATRAGSRSVFAEAYATASATLACAFMG